MAEYKEYNEKELRELLKECRANFAVEEQIARSRNGSLANGSIASYMGQSMGSGGSIMEVTPSIFSNSSNRSQRLGEEVQRRRRAQQRAGNNLRELEQIEGS